MTHGVGITDAKTALDALEDMTLNVQPITLEEYQARLLLRLKLGH